ncbi:MAG: prolyl oligopeptidase family serine peptidase, partial [Bacteroidaceae bacterium]|nr:prolyl oligopeptidase family serine peptidase [Bacteroidaceae bacterium]
PAFQILFYPVISMDSRYTHAGSRDNLLGSNPSSELVNLYSNELQVTSETPPCYICWASNDDIVKPINSTKYKSALKKAEVDVTSKTFSSGGHGFGFNSSFAFHKMMVSHLTEWLEGLDGILTGIDDVVAYKPSNGISYNLSGQRVNEHFKGIVIKDGKKTLVR